MHDFKDKQLGKAIPYGIYDIAADRGWVNVGIDHDTAQFAVNSIRGWWQHLGSSRYPKATRLQITADCGGSNGNRVRLWKVELQRLADETGLEIAVCHLPPGTSKWNRIEHRLFSYITMNWRGKPLISLETMINLIGATKTSTGLEVYSFSVRRLGGADRALASAMLHREEAVGGGAGPAVEARPQPEERMTVEDLFQEWCVKHAAELRREDVAVSGEVGWPPLGRNRWPLTPRRGPSRLTYAAFVAATWCRSAGRLRLAPGLSDELHVQGEGLRVARLGAPSTDRQGPGRAAAEEHLVAGRPAPRPAPSPSRPCSPQRRRERDLPCRRSWSGRRRGSSRPPRRSPRSRRRCSRGRRTPVSRRQAAPRGSAPGSRLGSGTFDLGE